MLKIKLYGLNTKSISAAVFYANHGYSVTLYCYCEPTESHLNKYLIDAPLTKALRSGMNAGQLQFNSDTDPQILPEHSDKTATLERLNEDVHWIFTDVLTVDQGTALHQQLKKTGDTPILLSGVLPTGSMDKITKSLPQYRVYYVPFIFLRSSSAYESINHPHLVLVGEKLPGTAKSEAVIHLLLQNADEFAFADVLSVELARSTLLASMATQLSLTNELARLADALGADFKKASTLAKLDKRVSSSYINAGWGYGGQSLPAEIKVLREAFDYNNISTSLLNAVQTINEEQKQLIFEKMWRYFDTDLSDKAIMIWGAGYKKGSSRIPGSALIKLAPLLVAHGAKLSLFDPKAKLELTNHFGELPFKMASTAYEQLEDYDALLILNWSESYPVEEDCIKQAGIPVFDAANLLDATTAGRLTHFYTGIGQGQKC